MEGWKDFISLLTPVVLAFLAYVSEKTRRDNKNYQEYIFLSLHGTSVIGDLAKESARTHIHGKHNGNLEECIEEYDAWKSKMAAFKNEQASKTI